MSKLYVSGRERKIIELLLKSDTSMSIHQLAAELGVSDRTVHRDLKHVEEISERHQVTLLRKPGKGLQIIGSIVNKNALLQIVSQTKQTDFTPEERRVMILLVLLEESYPVKLYTLAHKLHVTEATISNDIDQMVDYLRRKNLKLVRRRGYGVKISGEESNKRLLMSELMNNYVSDMDVLAILQTDVGHENNQVKSMIADRLLHLINFDTLKRIEREVDKLRDRLSFGLADSAYIGLVVHLALVVQRLEQGEAIEFKATYLEKMVSTKEYAIAKKMIKQLEKSLNISIPDAEIGYITQHLLGAKLQKDDNPLLDDMNLGIAQQTKKLINYISEEVGRDLASKPSLLSDLVTHLKPALFRLEKGMHISNPIMEEIKQHYQALFSVVQEGIMDVFPDIDFPDEEVGFLVLHFGAALLHTEQHQEIEVLVICPSGIGTAKMLGERLVRTFPEITKVHNVSYFDLNPDKMAAYDLVVSTIALKDYEDYVQTSPILREEDIDRIKRAMKRKMIVGNISKQKKTSKVVMDKQKPTIERIKSIQTYTHAILQILEKFTVETCIKQDSLEDYIKVMCLRLFERGLVNDPIVVQEALFARKKIGGLGIPDTSLALIHTRSEGVEEISFTMFTLPESMEIEGMDGLWMNVNQLLVLLSPKSPTAEELEVLSYLSSLIIQDEASVTLFETAGEVAVYDYLVEAYNLLMNDKFI